MVSSGAVRPTLPLVKTLVRIFIVLVLSLSFLYLDVVYVLD